MASVGGRSLNGPKTVPGGPRIPLRTAAMAMTALPRCRLCRDAVPTLPKASSIQSSMQSSVIDSVIYSTASLLLTALLELLTALLHALFDRVQDLIGNVIGDVGIGRHHRGLGGRTDLELDLLELLSHAFLVFV